MPDTAWVIIVLAVLVVLAALAVSRGGRPRANMIPLSNESRDRFLAEWDRIEMHFVEAPQEAVSEADALVISLLRERRHPLSSRSLPGEVQQARHDAAARRGDATEGMRRALLRYRGVVEKMTGGRVGAGRDPEVRREMA